MTLKPILVNKPNTVWAARIHAGPCPVEADVGAIYDGRAEHVATVPIEQAQAVKKLLTSLWFEGGQWTRAFNGSWTWRP